MTKAGEIGNSQQDEKRKGLECGVEGQKGMHVWLTLVLCIDYFQFINIPASSYGYIYS